MDLYRSKWFLRIYMDIQSGVSPVSEDVERPHEFGSVSLVAFLLGLLTAAGVGLKLVGQTSKRQHCQNSRMC